VCEAVAKKVAIARKVDFRPGGSKVNLAPAVADHRRVHSTQLAFAVRDRNFMPAQLLQKNRELALSGKTPPPYPLRRHCLESYLLEPAFVRTAIGVDIHAKLGEMVEARRWTDVCRAVHEDVAYRVREPRPSTKAKPASEEEAVEAVREALRQYNEKVDASREEIDAAAIVHAFASDFDADGPLWTRLDGKKLMGAIEQWLGNESLLPGGDLKKKLLDHAKLHSVPEPLASEMEELIRRIGEQVVT